MNEPLIAIVGDLNPERTYDPPMRDPALAKRAAERLGTELAERGARLLVYGGHFLESDVVRGFVAGKPARDRAILMWYSSDKEPPPFDEEKARPKLFERRVERGANWETAFYRSITRADGLVLMGGGNATAISGQVAIGSRMPILAISHFGGAASKVWDTLSPGEDLPNRAELTEMGRPWTETSAAGCVDALFAQQERRRLTDGAPSPLFSLLAGSLFLAALAIIPWVWGQNALQVWMLFLAPLLAGGAGATIRQMVDSRKGISGVAPHVIATVVLGLVAGGIAGILFVTAQLTANASLFEEGDVTKIVSYAQRSIPFAVAVGFIAGLTSDAVFGKLLGIEVIKPQSLDALPKKIQ